MHNVKKTMLVGAGVITLGVSSVGIASAATTNTTSSSSKQSLAQEIATKFNLKESDVQSVIKQHRTETITSKQARRTAELKQAVSAGKLTQAQADHITAAWSEIDSLRESAISGTANKKTVHAEVKSKREALRDWLKQQNLDLKSILSSSKDASS